MMLAILVQTLPIATSTATTVAASDIYVVLQPLLAAVATAAAGVITAAGIYAVGWLRKKLNLSDAEAQSMGLQIDAQQSAVLQTAFTNAAGVALNRFGNSIQGKTIDVKDPHILAAVQSVIKTAPDAIKYFDLQNKPEEVAQKIIGKLSQIAVTSGPPTVAKPIINK